MVDRERTYSSTAHVRYGLWVAFISANLFFALLHPALTGGIAALPPFLGSLAASALLFVLPALGWRRLVTRAPRMLGLRLACDVGISTIVFLGCLVIVRLLSARR